MLSKVAQRVYWMARYLERAENTARMISAYHQVILDLPRGTEFGWDVFLKITASESAFNERFNVADERNVMKFLQADKHSPVSILSAIQCARENVRTTRDVLPASLWESVNELHLFAQEQADKSVARRRRYGFLTSIIENCQQITGLLDGSMSRDQGYDFYSLGRHLERADMTTRIVDVSAGLLLPRMDTPLPFDSMMWMNILKSLNALERYRWNVGPRVQAAGVLHCVLEDRGFPRAVAYCIDAMRWALEQLPRHEEAIETLSGIDELIASANTKRLAKQGLHKYLDVLQRKLIAVDQSITEAWFQPA